MKSIVVPRGYFEKIYDGVRTEPVNCSGLHHIEYNTYQIYLSIFLTLPIIALESGPTLMPCAATTGATRNDPSPHPPARHFICHHVRQADRVV
jgi:hypothetical protein